MKTAIYIQDGVLQVVLTPESDLEKMALEKLRDTKNLETYRGGFYACRGGWIREDTNDESTIFIHQKAPPAPAEPEARRVFIFQTDLEKVLRTRHGELCPEIPVNPGPVPNGGWIQFVEVKR